VKADVVIRNSLKYAETNKYRGDDSFTCNTWIISPNEQILDKANKDGKCTRAHTGLDASLF